MELELTHTYTIELSYPDMPRNIGVTLRLRAQGINAVSALHKADRHMQKWKWALEHHKKLPKLTGVIK